MNNFSQQTILITGAAGNLGQSVARKFHSAGANLILFDRHAERLEAAFPELSALAGHLLQAVDAWMRSST